MNDYRPRPDDDLVEPLFGGLSGADATGRQEDAPRRQGAFGRRVRWAILAVLGLLAGGALLFLT